MARLRRPMKVRSKMARVLERRNGYPKSHGNPTIHAAGEGRSGSAKQMDRRDPGRMVAGRNLAEASFIAVSARFDEKLRLHGGGSDVPTVT
jgi:hypothetical protein